MAGLAAVGVNDDLASGEAAVADWATDHKVAGRVDEQIAAKLLGVVHPLGKDWHDDMLPEIIGDAAGWRVGTLIVLSRDQNFLDRHRALVDIADADLRLAVRPQVVERAVLANFGQFFSEPMR